MLQRHREIDCSVRRPQRTSIFDQFDESRTTELSIRFLAPTTFTFPIFHEIAGAIYEDFDPTKGFDGSIEERKCFGTREHGFGIRSGEVSRKLATPSGGAKTSRRRENRKRKRWVWHAKAETELKITNFWIVINTVAYASIDWHDFVVVEAVDYQPYETGNFPPPTNPDEVGARVLMEVNCLKWQKLNWILNSPKFTSGTFAGRRWWHWDANWIGRWQRCRRCKCH